MTDTLTPSRQITEEVTSWDGVESGYGRRGEFAFKVRGREIGHLHGDHAAHFFFPKDVWATLFNGTADRPSPRVPRTRGSRRAQDRDAGRRPGCDCADADELRPLGEGRGRDGDESEPDEAEEGEHSDHVSPAGVGERQHREADQERGAGATRGQPGTGGGDDLARRRSRRPRPRRGVRRGGCGWWVRLARHDRAGLRARAGTAGQATERATRLPRSPRPRRARACRGAPRPA